jgi:alkanesulfonate monooxygenase
VVEPPDQLAPKIEPALDAGIEVGIITNLIAAPTYDEAVEAGCALAENAGELGKAAVAEWREKTTESVGFTQTYQLAEEQPNWLTPYLWTGLVPYMGPMSISLVGGPDEIVESIFEYRRIGVTQFMFQARPDLPTLELFGAEILPKIKQREELEPHGTGNHLDRTDDAGRHEGEGGSKDRHGATSRHLGQRQAEHRPHRESGGGRAERHPDHPAVRVVVR